jgi:hypothetical protein
MSKQQRVVIFGSASCDGWAFSYEADDKIQRMIHRHVERYNSPEENANRNYDGSAAAYDSVQEALDNFGEDFGFDTDNERIQAITSIEELLRYYREDCFGGGLIVDAAWVVHMLLSDATAEGWLPE